MNGRTNMRKWPLLIWTLTIVFVGLCALRVYKAGFCSAGRCNLPNPIIPLAAAVQPESAVQPAASPEQTADTQQTPAEPEEPVVSFDNLSAVSGPEQTVTLGALYDVCRRTNDPSQYKFQVELTTRGAAVKTVTLSEFDDRHKDNPQPFVLLKPILTGERPIYTLASTSLSLTGNKGSSSALVFPLDRLNWTVVEQSADKAVFEALLGQVETRDGQRILTVPQIRLRKTYRIEPGRYDLTCELTVENLTEGTVRQQLQIQGTAAVLAEDIRTDERNIIAAYRTQNNSVETRLLEYPRIRSYVKELSCPEKPGAFTLMFGPLVSGFKKIFGSSDPQNLLQMKADKSASFLWAASTNKYFAAVIRPESAAPIAFTGAQYHDPQLCQPQGSPDAGATYRLQTDTLSLAPAGRPNSTQTLTFECFLGPKDKRLFDKNPTYRAYAYYQTFAMRSCCCCPAFLTQPLAFAIMWLMTALYQLMGPWGNYGIVIMVLVFLMRLVLHPITKKSQVTMMKVQKLGPQLQEVQQKYKGNPQEMQRKIAEVYHQAGMTQFSPMVGMMPMFLQMPIWIALWTAVYTSIDLRGAGFLPFWITDLSAPDALIHFGRFAFTIPLIGLHIESLNLLPILMGVVMYLQQKLTPQTQPAETARPEVVQQQKIMMILFPLLFPLMLYNGPSGVNLYIMASIGAGVIEQYVIRRHLQQQEAEKEKRLVPATAKTGGKPKKKKPKPLFREYK
ncbi:MAG TPA: YidC/Oxa1 family insertase periplasmic-domain containing protein [Anaerohalosphaeraceae bacterium]|nr:YidC/Oxa1 family insertase periplasmic-domain containing protein [Anaerohalosphaeraceae bacterium]